jgi:hypothetical protein
MAQATPVKAAKARTKYHDILYNEFPIRAKGDRTMEPLAIAVATALSSWEAMDERMSFLFAALVQSKNGAASAAYGVQTSFSAQMKMIRAASEAVFQSDHILRKRIADLLKELDALHGKRSNIAHGIIRNFMSHSTDKRGRRRTKGSGFFLAPPFHNTKKQLSIEELNEAVKASATFFGEFHRWRKHAYTSKEIAKIEKVISHYSKVIVDLHMDLMVEMKKRDKEREARFEEKRLALRQERAG